MSELEETISAMMKGFEEKLKIFGEQKALYGTAFCEGAMCALDELKKVVKK